MVTLVAALRSSCNPLVEWEDDFALGLQATAYLGQAKVSLEVHAVVLVEALAKCDVAVVEGHVVAMAFVLADRFGA